MISDTERREVALRLRYEADRGEMHLRDFLGSLCACIRQERNAYKALHRLADLIDPDGADLGPRDLARAWGWK